MPMTRKASGSRQTTLSFNHRVTKASVQRQSAKEAALLTDKVERVETVGKEEKKRGEDEDEDEDEDEVEEKVEVEDKKVAAEADNAQEAEAETEEEDEEEDEKVAKAKAHAVIARPQAEIDAETITDAQVKRYWRDIESSSIARRVHQEDMNLGEKILRHFDLSSQYGPCVGIERKTRWVRAQRLGLAPPIEVLAVMLQEEAKGVKGVERSSFDAILNAPTVA